MFTKRKIPKIVYTALYPIIPIPQKINKLKSLLGLKDHAGKNIEHSLNQTPSEKGHNEYIQNQMRKKEETKDIVDQLVKKSNRRIISINSFSLFPVLFKNTIEVEESRIIFIFKQPFTFQSHSVDIADVSNVFIESALLFASMQVVSRTFIQNSIRIGYLNKNEAAKTRMIIEGLRAFARAKIDTSVYETDELIKKLEELHTTR